MKSKKLPKAKSGTSDEIAKHKPSNSASQKPDQEPDQDGPPRNKPRPWYCFQCGEDGHIRPNCDKEPNPSLFAVKKEQLREKLQKWEAQQASTDPLN